MGGKTQDLQRLLQRLNFNCWRLPL